MSDKTTTPQQPPLHFLLDCIILEVKDAKKTHAFLCDVFAKANPAAPWPNSQDQAPQGSSLTQDGRHAIFRMGNTRVQFTTTASSNTYVPDHHANIAVLIKDFERVQRVLDQHNVKIADQYKVRYTTGRFNTLPGSPRLIEFKDQDGYTWNVSELVQG